MKEIVVVTLRSDELSGSFDIEVPIDVPAGQLSDNIAEVFNNYLENPPFNDSVYQLYCDRQNRFLENTETFLEAGIWNGDVIRMIKKHDGERKRKIWESL